MKRIFLLTLLLLLNISIFSNGSGAFDLDLKNDVIIGSSAILAFGTGTLLRNIPNEQSSSFGWIDEGITFEYSEGLDSFSDYLSLAPLLVMPLLVDKWDVENMTVLGVMCIESAFLTWGIKDILKSIIRRPRPYNYFPSTPGELLADNDKFLGYPSGHTSIAFMGASFSTYIFSKGSSSKTSKYLMGVATFGLATTTAVLRVTSGKHYIFDVVTGAALGSLFGFGVPYVHKVLPEKISLVINHNGIGVSISL
jgi:membrane-associated phospholipid phosphatase